jgi:cell division protein FtsQ
MLCWRNRRTRASSRPTRRRLRRPRNRRVRSLRSRLPAPRAVGRAVARLLRRGAPAVIAVLGLVAAGGACWGVHYWLTHSERFAIQEIAVRGNRARTAERIRRLAGVTAGDNIFVVPRSRVAEKVARDPWFEQVDVHRELPGRLVIAVREHRAAGLVELEDLYLATASGQVFKRAAIEAGEGASLPVVTGIDRQDYLANPRVAQAAIRQALETAASYSDSDNRPALGEVHVDARQGITLLTYDTALAIHLGRSTTHRLGEQLQAFDIAWAELGEGERVRAEQIYVNNDTNPGRITVGFRTPGTH